MDWLVLQEERREAGIPPGEPAADDPVPPEFLEADRALRAMNAALRGPGRLVSTCGKSVSVPVVLMLAPG